MAEVKDEKRFPTKWAFFGFGTSASDAKALPVSATCYSCHAANGAVDNTFVQFYPTLLEVAKSKGTRNAKAEQAAASEERVDDVVGNMPVDPKQSVKSAYKGKTYYFCSEDCKHNFEAAPATYLSATKPGASKAR
jgi:YHS domain-containing protein